MSSLNTYASDHGPNDKGSLCIKDRLTHKGTQDLFCHSSNY